MTMPIDQGGHDSALVNLTDRTATTGQLYEGADYNNFSPRVGVSWDVDRRRPHGGARRLRAVLRHQQLAEPDRDGDQSARYAARGVPDADVPESAVRAHLGPVDSPGAVGRRDAVDSCLERQRAARARRADGDHAGLCRFARTATCCAATTSIPRCRRPAPMAGRSSRRALPRINTAWTTIEAKTSDGDSWYKAFIVDVRRRLAAGWSFQGSYTWSDSEDTTQASTFFSDATNGTTSAFPEFIPDYNRGPSDFNVRHNLVANMTWEIPWGRDLSGVAGALLSDWRALGDRHVSQRLSADGVRAEQPLAIAVAAVARSRHRPRPAELRAGLRRRRTPSPAIPSSGSIRRRSCCSRPARSATPAAATSRGRTCAWWTWRSPRTRR